MKKDLESKREKEKATVHFMIQLYCRGHHGQKKTLCPACEALYRYAEERINHCPFMETKTFCSNCKVHCYRPEKREEIRTVMRYSGPRMMLYHPVQAVRHLIETKKEKRKQEKQEKDVCK